MTSIFSIIDPLGQISLFPSSPALESMTFAQITVEESNCLGEESAEKLGAPDILPLLALMHWSILSYLFQLGLSLSLI